MVEGWRQHTANLETQPEGLSLELGGEQDGTLGGKGTLVECVMLECCIHEIYHDWCRASVSLKKKFSSIRNNECMYSMYTHSFQFIYHAQECGLVVKMCLTCVRPGFNHWQCSLSLNHYLAKQGLKHRLCKQKPLGSVSITQGPPALYWEWS